jgi:AMP-binding enzyme
MQEFPLTLPLVFRRAARESHAREVVAAADRRATWGDVASRGLRLCRVLEQLGLERGDRVGSFAWNTEGHLELYLAAPCSGRVLPHRQRSAPPRAGCLADRACGGPRARRQRVADAGSRGVPRPPDRCADVRGDGRTAPSRPAHLPPTRATRTSSGRSRPRSRFRSSRSRMRRSSATRAAVTRKGSSTPTARSYSMR